MSIARLLLWCFQFQLMSWFVMDNEQLLITVKTFSCHNYTYSLVKLGFIWNASITFNPISNNLLVAI